MSDEGKPELFLLGQELLRLKGDLPAEERKQHVCGSGFEEKAWEFRPRDVLCKDILGDQPPHRVALVCDAGLGKTTNMEWLHDHLAENPGQQLPMLLHLKDMEDRKLLEEERAPGRPSDAFVLRLAKLIEDKAGGEPDQLVSAIRRLQSAGRITVLIDGLDHVPNTVRTAGMLKEMLECEQWRNCPAWVSGRPTAFETCWKSMFADPHWQFYRVNELAKPEIRFYLAHNAGSDWYAEFPDESRRLLAIPRLLHLICGIVRRAVSGAKDDLAKLAAFRELKLRTPADVYCQAFLHIGAHDDPNDQGLLAQGLKGKPCWIGLDKNAGFRPRKSNRKQRVERMAALLGAIAFEMLHARSEENEPQPNFGGVMLDPFKSRVAKRMKAAGKGTLADFDRDLDFLRDMNIHALDHLLFREASEERLAFHDRTTQAFFAAYWACRHAKVDKKVNELDATREWVVDALFDKNLEYREFWQFAAEMPDEGFPKDKEDNADEGRWLTLFRALYDGSVKDTKKRPIRSTEFIYRSWPRMERNVAGQKQIAQYQGEFQAIMSGNNGEHRKRLAEEMLAGFIPLVCSGKTRDSGTFWMGARAGEDASDVKSDIQDNPRHKVKLSPYLLHRYCVTNIEYELFNPPHANKRWQNGKHLTVELTKAQSADDLCPAVMVSWYDAFCFSAWLGSVLINGVSHKIIVPTEAQWEYGCRSGQQTPFTFFKQHNGLTCGPFDCNHWGKIPLPEGSPTAICRVGGELTLPVAKMKPNPWGFYQMHGNVCEWCQDWYSAFYYKQGEKSCWNPLNNEPAFARVLRGGCLTHQSEFCRSAYRNKFRPDGQLFGIGFRLAAVPDAAKPSKQ